jgi:hypothetical protein
MAYFILLPMEVYVFYSKKNYSGRSSTSMRHHPPVPAPTIQPNIDISKLERVKLFQRLFLGPMKSLRR